MPNPEVCNPPLKGTRAQWWQRCVQLLLQHMRCLHTSGYCRPAALQQSASAGLLKGWELLRPSLL